MIIVAPWPETVERRHGVPNQISITQATALLDVYRETEFLSSGAPEFGEFICAGIARPRAAFAKDFDFQLAGKSIGDTADFTWAREREQTSLRLCIDLRRERAELAFSDGFMRNAIEHGAAGDRADVEGQVAGVIGHR